MSDISHPPDSVPGDDEQAAVGAAWLADRTVGPRLLLCGEYDLCIVAELAAAHDVVVWNASAEQLRVLSTALDTLPTSVRQRVVLEKVDPTQPRSPNAPYETVIVGSLLTQVADLPGLMSNIHAWLTEGGRLLVYTPHGPASGPSAVRRTYCGALVDILVREFKLVEVQPVGGGWIGAHAVRSTTANSPPSAEQMLAWERACHSDLERTLERLAQLEAEVDARVTEVERQYRTEHHRLGNEHLAERQRRRMAEARIERLKAQVEHYKSELMLREQEVRYQLGDAFVRAARPSLDTLKLPGRLLGLLFRGLRRQSDRREEARQRRLASTPASASAGQAERSTGVMRPTFDGAAELPQPFASTPPELLRRDDIRVAAVTDEFSWRAWQYEAPLTTFKPTDWRAALESVKPGLLFIESAWSGIGDSWYFQIRDLGQRDEVIKHYALPDVIEWCRAAGIPTVFYNKEDPPNFDVFIDAAKLFDYVFTSDANCIPDYCKHIGHDRVFALPFAAQPRIHNPIRSGPRDGNVCFAGTWYAHRHFARQDDALRVLRPALEFDLHVYDRMADSGNPNYRWPDAFLSAIRGALPYAEMLVAYKRYKAFLNINSVTNSPTMFSRRVFELLACGTPVISSYSEGIEEMFGADLVLMSEDEATTRSMLERLLGDDDYRERLALRGQRKVFCEHTYTHRLQQVLDEIDLARPSVGQPPITFIAAVEDAQQLAEAWDHYRRQTYDQKRLIICAVDPASVATVDTVTRGAANASVKCNAGASWGAILADAVRAAEPGFVAALHPSYYYGRSYLTDYANVALYAPTPAFGKATHYHVEGDAQPRVVNAGGEYQLAEQVHPWTLCLSQAAAIAATEQVQNAGDAHAFWAKLGQQFERVYSADRFNYVAAGVAASGYTRPRQVEIAQV